MTIQDGGFLIALHIELVLSSEEITNGIEFGWQYTIVHYFESHG